MTIFYIIFLAMFKGSAPSIEVVILNFIMILIVLALAPAMNEINMFINSLISSQKIDVVFIPDEGDSVEVFFTNEEIFCVSALRENPLPEECRKVAEKYIGNNSKQRIFLREKSLELHSDKYKILMDERGIELTVDKNSIVINKQGILLQTADSKISVAKDGVAHIGGKLELQAKDTEIKSGDKIKLGGSDIAIDSSGSTNVKAGGKLKLAGSKIELC